MGRVVVERKREKIMKSFLIIGMLFIGSVSFGSATRTLDGQQITNNGSVLTLPSITTSLIGVSDTAVLSNKTISGSSNTFSSIPASAISTGVISIANGGTGQSTSGTAFNALAPDQSGNAGMYLTTDGTIASWGSIAASAPSLDGSRASPTSVAAAVGVVFSGSAYENYYFVQGLAGAVTVTANPQIAAGTLVGQRLVIIGRSATNTVTLSDGNGLSLNGPLVLGLDSIATLVWDGVAWTEANRR